MKEKINLLRDFSVPLLVGVAVALTWANLSPAGYDRFMRTPVLGLMDVEFVANELFMVFFFAIAAVEITLSCLPGGSLNPPHKAVNPLLSTLGGVIGPIAVYLILNAVWGSPSLLRGWGIPTATDIALAWLVARMLFGGNHPVISFLLLLAIADDAIGLVIISVFYPDPSHPVVPAWLLLPFLGVLSACALRKRGVMNYWYYLLSGGVLSWIGLFKAHLHPALALVFIVPFLPPPQRDTKSEVFEEESGDPSPLCRFEHDWRRIVDFGLFLFGLANAGIPFSKAQTVTWLVFLALLLGKGMGVFLMGLLSEKLGFSLPEGMNRRHLLVAGVIAGIGFTVALFMAGVAFAHTDLREAAKMGAVLSIVNALIAALLAKLLRVRRVSTEASSSSPSEKV
ncbi:MAG: Na+/H+ antiporter NhaA [Thermodesulfovibrionales bacterium]